MRSVVVQICSLLLVSLFGAGRSVCQGAGVGWEDFRLPYAVAGEAKRHISSNNVVLEQHHVLRFECSRDWVRSELWVSEGSFGTVLMQFQAHDMGQSLHYSGPSRRGDINDTFSRWGFSSSEASCGPIYIVRLLVRAYDTGLPVERTDLGGNRSRFVWNEPAVRSRFEMLMDTEAGTVLEVRRGDETDFTRNEYHDWRSVGGNRLYPFRVESVSSAPREPEPTRRSIEITNLRVLPQGAKPTPYTLPSDAVIVNHLTGTASTGSGSPVEIQPENQHARRPGRPILSARNVFIAVAVLAVAAAGLVTALKRRGVM